MKSIDVKFPTDGGYFGRQCNSKGCGKYFKINSDQIKEEMHCPYCGERFKNDELWTDEQNDYIKNVAEQEARRYAQDEIDKMFSRLARRSKNMTFKRGNRPIYRKPKPKKEKKVDSEIRCPDCLTEFQVYGVFGYCPICNEENMMIYDANIKIIKQEIDLSDNPNRALRHAYKDLVSTFEFYCKNTAKKLELGNINFQEIKGTRKFFRKSKYKIDIYSDITERGKIDVKRVFQKRHAYEHHNGEISERYIKELPEDRNLLGQKADLSYSEFENGAKIVRKMLQPIVDLISKNIK